MRFGHGSCPSVAAAARGGTRKKGWCLFGRPGRRDCQGGVKFRRTERCAAVRRDRLDFSLQRFDMSWFCGAEAGVAANSGFAAGVGCVQNTHQAFPRTPGCKEPP
ncbi:hypothetical protein C882_2558 [Caenispirillum salinarum AK4]|uniref:Uncharacterized protein n=1 Tax=Caenispirillum salinarum AK4 TaxID=1238182 RepID=K9H5V0_9PROT|nr:hypothetical protein C882_2558 [Caenispirillum salinarum AK4]